MILPSKHLPQDRALLTVGGQVLGFLTRPKTVSALWEELRVHPKGIDVSLSRSISYDWFLLALDLLYALEAIKFENGLVTRSAA